MTDLSIDEADANEHACLTDFEAWPCARMADLGRDSLGLANQAKGWHTPMLVTIREYSQRNHRQRSEQGQAHVNRRKAEEKKISKQRKQLARQAAAAKRDGTWNRPCAMKRPSSQATASTGTRYQ